MIDRGEELFDVAFQHPTGARMIFRALLRVDAKPVHGFVRPFPYAAGVGIVDEYFVEKRVQSPVDGVMQEPIAHTCFVDVARLGIGNLEVVIPAVAVSLTY